jgi:Protein of unknown function (DUF2637)
VKITLARGVRAMLTRPPREPRRPRPPKPPRLLPGPLRWARTLALWAAAVVVAAATSVALAESYRALYLWADGHGVHGGWAAAWPLMVDSFVVAGELAVFLGTVDEWEWRPRAYAWLVIVGGLMISVAGNIGHQPSATRADRLTFALPPLAAFIGLTIGVGILKRTVEQHGARRLAGVAALVGDFDTGTVVRALVDAGIADTGTLAALTGVSVRTARRHRAAAVDDAAAAAAKSGHPAATDDHPADTIDGVSVPRWGARRPHWQPREAPSGS